MVLIVFEISLLVLLLVKNLKLQIQRLNANVQKISMLNIN